MADTERISVISEILRTAQRKELRREWREASLKPGPPAGKCETEDLDKMIENAPFHEDPYPLNGDAVTMSIWNDRQMQQVCKCGHDRYHHEDATDSCDHRRECGCIDFRKEERLEETK